MNTQKISKIEKSYIRTDLPNFKVGDTIAVDTIIREGEKQRIQTFKGLVISIQGSGTRKTFTIRKISYGVGVEKVLPWNSPNISKIAIIKDGSVRRSKLYYLRDRVGKLALKVKPGKPAPVVEHEEETQEILEQTVEPELTDGVVEEPKEGQEAPATEESEETVESTKEPTETSKEPEVEEAKPE